MQDWCTHYQRSCWCREASGSGRTLSPDGASMIQILRIPSNYLYKLQARGRPAHVDNTPRRMRDGAKPLFPVVTALSRGERVSHPNQRLGVSQPPCLIMGRMLQPAARGRRSQTAWLSQRAYTGTHETESNRNSTKWAQMRGPASMGSLECVCVGVRGCVCLSLLANTRWPCSCYCCR